MSFEDAHKNSLFSSAWVPSFSFPASTPDALVYNFPIYKLENVFAEILGTEILHMNISIFCVGVWI